MEQDFLDSGFYFRNHDLVIAIPARLQSSDGQTVSLPQGNKVAVGQPS
jgi:hypothetical protein